MSTNNKGRDSVGSGDDSPPNVDPTPNTNPPPKTDSSPNPEPPTDVFVENAKETVNWSMAFQEKSPLVNLENEHCLLLFFSYLSLADGFHLSVTCRRLYHFFKESCKVRKSLVLTKGSQTLAYKLEKMFTDDGALVEDQFIKRLPLSSVYISSGRKDDINLSLTVVQKLLATLPNLTYLEIAGNIKCEDFFGLISELNALNQLETLKLYLRISDNWKFVKSTTTAKQESSSEKNSSACPQLQIPSLKHLTMCLKRGFLKSAGIISTPKDGMPCTSIISQLSTFHSWSDDSIPNLCHLISQYIRPNAQLVAGSSSAMIGVYFKPFQAKNYLNDVESLAYITSLRVDNLSNDANFKKMLSSLVNLREFSFAFGDRIEVEDYPAVLTALSKLPFLKTISVDAVDTPNELISERHRWPRSAMPVLSSVTTLSIKYLTVLHDDVVEQFHLKHCFPELKLLQCTFDFSACEDGHFDEAVLNSFLEETDEYLEPVYLEGTMTIDRIACQVLKIFGLGKEGVDYNRAERKATISRKCYDTMRLYCGTHLISGMTKLSAKKEISFLLYEKTGYLLYNEENNTVSLASDQAK